MQDDVLHLEGIRKSYGSGDLETEILHGIDLRLQRGEFAALIGPSGSGKSTLLNLIAGIDQPTSGTIRIAGVDIATLDETALADWRAANVGFIFQ